MHISRGAQSQYRVTTPWAIPPTPWITLPATAGRTSIPAITALPPVFIGTYFLLPDQPFFIPLPPPPVTTPDLQVIVETHGFWSLNQNQTVELEQIPFHPAATPPRLEIVRTSPQTLELHWSDAYPLYNVQQTDHLPAATWPPVLFPRQHLGNEFVIFMSINPASPPQFFRLSNGP